jgi:HEAT repeat protein
VIELHGDRLSLQARNVPWEVVLQELERHTGISIRVEGPLPGTLTQGFKSLTLEQGLRRIFRNANLVLFYTKGTGEGTAAEKLARVWLLPRESSTREEVQVRYRPAGPAAATRRANPDAEEKVVEAIPPDDEAKSEGESAVEEQDPTERLEALDAFAREGNTEALQKALLDPDQTIRVRAFELLAERNSQGATAFVVQMTKSDEPKTRLQGLSLLDESGKADERIVLSAHSAALADEDLSVKSYAIEALASRGGPDALAYLRQAFGNPDPSIRMIVIESIVPEGEGLSLLQEALSDEDGTIRSLAAFRLKQVGFAGR